MGDAVGLTVTAERVDRLTGWLRGVRFGLGLAGLFVSTVAVSLTVLAVVGAAVPGWNATVVASSSMEPAVRRGDVVIFGRSEMSEVGVGTVIVFSDHGTSMVHRVVKVNEDATLTTKGDANPSADTSHVTDDDLSGTGFLLVPWVGLPRMWWLEGNRALVALAVLITLLALRSSRWASDVTNDPWRGRASISPAASWLGRPAPPMPTALLSPTSRALILDRARSCG